MVLFGFIKQQLVGMFIMFNQPIFSFEYAKSSTKNIRVTCQNIRFSFAG